MKLSRIMTIISIITFVVVIATFGYVFYLLVWPINIVDLRRFEVTQASVPLDGSIPYIIEFDKHIGFKPEIRYYITSEIDPAVEIVVSSVRRETGAQTRNLAIPVPQSVNPGCGKRLQIDLSYAIILNRTIEYSWRSNEFCIVKTDTTGGT